MARSDDGAVDVQRGDDASAQPLWVVIPAGGIGSRLWPVSYPQRPKFLLPLLGTETLLQQTVARMAPLTTPGRTLVVCGPAHAAQVSRQLPSIPESGVIVEPGARGTGPAIALAAAIIAREDPDALFGAFAADHDVRDPLALHAAVRSAIVAARDGWIVSIGIRPTTPDTGYGYIERTDEVIATLGEESVHRAVRFEEKPDLPTASRFLRSGKYLWHASMFVARVSTFLGELERFEPALHERVIAIADEWGDWSAEARIANEWVTLDEGTVEKQVLERTSRMAVVPASIGWSDVGEWQRLAEVIGSDDRGNSILRHGRTDVLNEGVSNTILWSEMSRPIALVNVDNLVVIDTPHTLLIADRSKIEDVREVARLIDQAKEPPEPPRAQPPGDGEASPPDGSGQA